MIEAIVHDPSLEFWYLNIFPQGERWSILIYDLIWLIPGMNVIMLNKFYVYVARTSLDLYGICVTVPDI